ncbi:cytochrome c biogenesis protein CcsA [Spirosoma oryzicola]|uniref:cytochrome c biogenesis protein CcsA n=1 Tax=Spirosoma oryzicola TaxID=2898794 RepID=UPI001E39A9C7|nr:cytochrome c biogenesis protein CcsA [Spirosoma oryzicola]UHG94466.1 cytochrome c biogenesis protein [Spirosoma oryzicola]
MAILKHWWWKILTVLILMYVFIAGLMSPVPKLPILHEAIRNTFFHPPLWIAMMSMLLGSAIFSIRYLRKGRLDDDLIAVELANTALLFGVLGCITGSVWAYFAWGDLWPNDPKTNGVAVGMLLYLAYFVLRGSFDDDLRRGRISAVYNIFAFAVFIPLILILPRLTDSLHPGNGGNPGFNQYDADSSIKRIIRPAFVGFTLLGFWITQLRVRLRRLESELEEQDEVKKPISQSTELPN